jgi:hypothetical protein
MGGKKSGKRKWRWKAIAYPKDRSLVAIFPEGYIIYGDSPEQLLRKLLKQDRDFWYGTDTLELTRAKGKPEEEMLDIASSIAMEFSKRRSD